jgi:hypothetical protein
VRGWRTLNAGRSRVTRLQLAAEALRKSIYFGKCEQTLELTGCSDLPNTLKPRQVEIKRSL